MGHTCAINDWSALPLALTQRLYFHMVLYRPGTEPTLTLIKWRQESSSGFDWSCCEGTTPRRSFDHQLERLERMAINIKQSTVALTGSNGGGGCYLRRDLFPTRCTRLHTGYCREKSCEEKHLHLTTVEVVAVPQKHTSDRGHGNKNWGWGVTGSVWRLWLYVSGITDIAGRSQIWECIRYSVSPGTSGVVSHQRTLGSAPPIKVVTLVYVALERHGLQLIPLLLLLIFFISKIQTLQSKRRRV